MRRAMKAYGPGGTLFMLAPAIVVLFCAPWALLAQTAGPQLPNPGNPSIGRDQQQKLGLQAAAEVYKQMPVLPDSSPETQYIRQVGKRLVATIPAQYSWPFDFHVVAQKEINAFALPGGEMFVNIGTITAAANEAQLVGVMSHEMSHVYMQHSAKQIQKAQLTQGLAGLAGEILGAKGGLLGTLGQQGVQIGAGMLVLKYSRSDEAQADSVGAMIMYRAGYDPQALGDFFKTLEAQGGTGPQFLSDHPNPGNRDLAIKKEIGRGHLRNTLATVRPLQRCASRQAASMHIPRRKSQKAPRAASGILSTRRTEPSSACRLPRLRSRRPNELSRSGILKS